MQVFLSDYKFMRKLGEMGTEQARAAMLRIAYGEIGGQYVGYAASVYARTLREKCQVRALLVSDSEKCLEAGLAPLMRLRLYECVMDRELFELLRRTIRFDSALLRSSSADAMQATAGTNYGSTVAQLIVDSMKTTLQTKDANQMIAVGPDHINFSESWKRGEYSLSEQALALGRVKGLPLRRLAELTPSEPGLVWEAVLLARFVAGEEAVRSEFYHLLTNCPSARLRWVGLHTIFRLPLRQEDSLHRHRLTEEEITVVKRMAETDPYEVAGFPEENQKKGPKVFPIREKADFLLRDRTGG